MIELYGGRNLPIRPSKTPQVEWNTQGPHPPRVMRLTDQRAHVQAKALVKGTGPNDFIHDVTFVYASVVHGEVMDPNRYILVFPEEEDADHTLPTVVYTAGTIMALRAQSISTGGSSGALGSNARAMHEATKGMEVKGKIKKRKKYSRDEDMILWDWIRDHASRGMGKKLKGIKLWNDMERAQILPGRTAYGLKGRFEILLKNKEMTEEQFLSSVNT